MDSRTGLSRRGILQGLTGAALATTLFKPGIARAHERGEKLEGFATKLRPVPTIRGSPGSEGYWNHVRNAFALPDNYIHMNTGTTGSQPLFLLAPATRLPVFRWSNS